MPDAPGTELLAQDLREAHGDDAVAGTSSSATRARSRSRPPRSRGVLQTLRGKGFKHLMSVHGVDYYPEEPRLGVHYELLDRDALDRLTVKLRVRSTRPTCRR